MDDGGWNLEFWPDRASAYAGELDLMLWIYTALIVALVVPIFAAQIYLIAKYRKGRDVDRSRRVSSRLGLELAWALIPFALIVVFAVWSANLYFRLQQEPAGATEIHVVAKQWMWKVQHPGGQRAINELHVPVGEPIKLVMISQDVIHSLFLPALRIKQDVVPGRYTTLHFTADRTGVYPLRCADYCGTEHSAMGGRLVVLTPAEYQRWLERADLDRDLASQGAALFRDYGCSGCHGANAVARAPRLDGIYGRPQPMADGGTKIVDARYIRDSILFPLRDVVAGFEPIMPSFEGQVGEADLLKLVAYIRSLSEEAEDAAP
jgi:cytochrome c oxidase subunit 2